MTVFDGNNQGATDQGQTTTTNTEESVFETLVGEDKPFKTREDLAKAKRESDAFIEKLKEENKGLRQDLDQRLSQEQILEQLKKEQQQAPREDDNTNHQPSTEDIAKLVRETVQGLSKEEQAQQNINEADSVMKEKFGDKAAEKLITKANEIGVSVEFLKSTASQSPKAFFELMGLQQNNSGNSPSVEDSSVNTEALANQNTEAKEGSLEYYNKLRTTNPKLFWSPKVQNKIFELTKAQMGS